MGWGRIGWTIVLILAVGAAYLAPAQAQGTVADPAAPGMYTVEAVGSEAVQGGDVAAAREKAIQAGLVSAVMMAAQDILAAADPGAASLPTALAAQIQAQPAGFIRHYRVVEESTAEDGATYTVLVEAEVAAEALSGALGSTAEPPPAVVKPTILLAIAEQGVGEFSPQFWWGGEVTGRVSAAAHSLGQELGRQGYPLVAHQTAARDSRFTARYAHPELTDPQALDLGARLGADVVIHGQARVEPGPASLGTKISTFRGTLSVRMLHVADGSLIAQRGETPVTVGTDTARDSAKALERAGAAVAEQLIPPLAALGQGPAGAMRQLEVSVIGTADLSRFVQLRRAIASLPGVGGLQILALQRDQARLQVAYSGGNQRFGEALRQRLAAEADLAIEPVDLAGVRIVLPTASAGAGRLQEKPLGN